MTPLGIARLKMDEASNVCRNMLYDDSTGKNVGRLASGGWATIGWGRNLSVNPLSDAECELLLENDLTQRELAIKAKSNVLYVTFIQGGTARGDVLTMVQYNMGNVFSFPKMLNAYLNNDWNTAHTELLDSAAARQLPARYSRMGKAIITNSWVGIS